MVTLSYSLIVLFPFGHYASSTFVNHVLIAFLLFMMVHYLSMFRQKILFEQKLRFCLDVVHKINIPLKMARELLDNLISGDSSVSASQKVRRAAGYMDDIMDYTNGILSLNSENKDVDIKTKSYELYTYITSLINHCREYADNHQVKLNVCKAAGYIGCSINEVCLTAALRSLVERVIAVTPHNGCVDVLVTCREDRWGLEISNSPHSGKYRKRYLGLSLTRLKVFFCGDLHFIQGIVQSHGGDITGYEQGKLIRYEITVPIKCGNCMDNVSAVDVHSAAENLPHIMLVTQDKVLSGYLTESLSAVYRITVVEDSKRIPRSLYGQDIDGVIVDEALDGMEICSRIKSNKRISDIPVVLLTASDDTHDNSTNKKCSADRLLPRAVDTGKLKETLQAFIEDRNRRQEQMKMIIEKEFSNGFSKVVTQNEVDEQIMEDVHRLLEEHLSEEGYTIRKLCADIGMCRTKFSTMVLQITGDTALHYIFSFKMKKAQQMLATSQFDIAEIATQLGFGTAEYFGKRFKKYWGDSPSEYRKKVLKGEISVIC